jgi:hypothetical protein
MIETKIATTNIDETKIGKAKNYFIKDGYVTRPDAAAFDDTPFKDEFQRPVYEYARSVAEQNGFEKITDVGCGSGFKLVKYFADFDTVGIELASTLPFLRGKYTDRKWMGLGSTPETDLAICADVIEHLRSPNPLLRYIQRLNPKRIIFSTPERDLLKLGTEDGPPRNIHHVREWNREEFAAYIGAHFTVLNHFVCETWTQVIECQPR